MPTNAGFVPPAAEEPAGMATTDPMPAMDDLSAITPAAADTPEPATDRDMNASHGPMGLLNKLKSSFGAREEEMQPSSAPVMPKPVTELRPSAPAEAKSEPAARVDNNPYAPKREQVDTMGRINPSAKPAQEDDQLDIPAFLRRQAN